MTERWLGWWFGDRLGYGDGRVPEVGSVLEVSKWRSLGLCDYGLHASKHALDALKYKGGTAWRVELIGEREDGDDKSCAYVRRHIGLVPDTSEVLRRFARYCASDVLHLWEPPRVVIDWLQTGDEELRYAAYAAAYAAAHDAAHDAAYDPARAKQVERLDRMLMLAGIEAVRVAEQEWQGGD